MQYGLREPKKAPALRFASFWKRVIPAHPVAVDYLPDDWQWRMYDNDIYGDCAAAMSGHLVRQVTSYLSTQYYPNLAEVFALYRTQNPSWGPGKRDPVTRRLDPGGGMDLQTLFEYWNHQPWAGRRIVAFAQVDFQNLEEVKAALAIFGSLCLGVRVSAVNEEQFERGLPWDYQRDSPNRGLHAVLAGGYRGQPLSDICVVTWGKETTFTQRYWTHCVVMAWIVVFKEHLGTKQFQEGCTVEGLKAAYRSLTGRVLKEENVVPRTGADNDRS